MGALGWPMAFAFPEKVGPAEVAGVFGSAGFEADAFVFVAAVSGVFAWVRADAIHTPAVIDPASMAMRRKIPIRWKGNGFTRVLSLEILFGVF
jgi:hypothetical protein